VDKTGTIGFDVTIIDRDPGDTGRRRNVWANIGAVNESWTTMDDCGLVTFDGAVSNVYVEKITLTGGTITKDNDTLRIKATVLPVDATVKILKWTVENKTGRATISSTGLLTPIMNGVVTVIADATDGSYEQAKIDITISGQIPTLWELNLIKNGLFDDPGTAGSIPFWGGWLDAAVPTTGTSFGSNWVVVDGVAVLESTGSSADNWHYQFSQSGQFTALPNIPYIVKFKAWAANGRNICFDFEDTPTNTYTRYGTSSDPNATSGYSEWTFPVTTVPTWYTFHVTFDKMVATTVQKIQFMISQAIGTVYLDSIMLISVADMALVTEVSIPTVESFKVYPNPAVNELNVVLNSVNTKVSIYNGLGVKMDEVVVPGTRYTFNVSSYAKGLYFVKANNNIVKFLK
jgi:Secretion system C-terminal sorting domain